MLNIKIGHMDYHYQELECVSKEELKRGEVNFINREIKVDNTMDKPTIAETVIHEVIHAIDDLMVIELEENQVNQLGAGMAMFIKDNPMIVNKIINLLGENDVDES